MTTPHRLAGRSGVGTHRLASALHWRGVAKCNAAARLCSVTPSVTPCLAVRESRKRLSPSDRSPCLMSWSECFAAWMTDSFSGARSQSVRVVKSAGTGCSICPPACLPASSPTHRDKSVLVGRLMRNSGSCATAAPHAQQLLMPNSNLCTTGADGQQRGVPCRPCKPGSLVTVLPTQPCKPGSLVTDLSVCLPVPRCQGPKYHVAGGVRSMLV